MMERIEIANTEFEGDNNVYVFDVNGEPTLVDTGVVTEEMSDTLENSLADLGLSFSDVERIFLTHWHQDHAGLAGRIQAESDAAVYVHKADEPLVSDPRSSYEQLSSLYAERFNEWGMPDDARDELEAFLRSSTKAEEGASVETFADGDRFEVGSHAFEVVHSPGHTAGLSCFRYAENGAELLLSGDALLPKYTPNVGGADVRVDRPLEAYLETLERLVGLDPDVAHPGHRWTIEDPIGRALTIIEHHEERAMRVLGALEQEGPANAWEVSALLFGDLSGIHTIHGPGEAYAHLEHLRSTGLIDRSHGDYRLASDAQERLEADLQSIVEDLGIWGERGAVERSSRTE